MLGLPQQGHCQNIWQSGVAKGLDPLQQRLFPDSYYVVSLNVDHTPWVCRNDSLQFTLNFLDSDSGL